jgi:hypothetical protein
MSAYKEYATKAITLYQVAFYAVAELGGMADNGTGNI